MILFVFLDEVLELLIVYYQLAVSRWSLLFVGSLSLKAKLLVTVNSSLILLYHNLHYSEKLILNWAVYVSEEFVSDLLYLVVCWVF